MRRDALEHMDIWYVISIIHVSITISYETQGMPVMEPYKFGDVGSAQN